MTTSRNCKILYKIAFVVTLVNAISVFVLGMSRLSWLVQLVCEIVLAILLIKEYHEARKMPHFLKWLLFTLGILLLAFPIPFSGEPTESTFSIAEYERNIRVTQQNPHERALLSGLPKLTNKEKRGEVVSDNAIKTFSSLFPDQDFYGAQFQLFIDETGQGYMYTTEEDAYEYRIVFDQNGDPVEYAKYLVR